MPWAFCVVEYEAPTPAVWYANHFCGMVGLPVWVPLATLRLAPPTVNKQARWRFTVWSILVAVGSNR